MIIKLCPLLEATDVNPKLKSLIGKVLNVPAMTGNLAYTVNYKDLKIQILNAVKYDDWQTFVMVKIVSGYLPYADSDVQCKWELKQMKRVVEWYLREIYHSYGYKVSFDMSDFKQLVKRANKTLVGKDIIKEGVHYTIKKFTVGKDGELYCHLTYELLEGTNSAYHGDVIPSVLRLLKYLNYDGDVTCKCKKLNPTGF